MLFETKECTNPDIVKELFVEYSHIKGAESCFVSFDKELNDLPGYASVYQTGIQRKRICKDNAQSNDG